MNRAIRGVAVAAGLAMAGCGPVGALIGGGGLAPRDGFAPEQVAAAPQDYMLFQVANRDISGLALRVQVNGEVQTWVGDSGYSVTLDDGLIVATRGLGGDLMAANTADVRAMLRQGGGIAERQHDYLDDRDKIRTETYTCTVVGAGPQDVDLGIRKVTAQFYTETCANDRIQFENQYFVDGSGTIVAARQFISQTVAYLRNNIL